MARLHHRGPDGQGTWVAPHRQAALGHARLSIIDLDTGAQPIANEDGQIHIAVNGEFYDHESTRRALEDGGHRFRTRSDSEIALHLYEDHGVDAVHRLRSEAAGAVPFLDAVALREIADRLPGVSRRQRIAVEPRLLFVMSMIFLQRRFSVQD